MTSRRVKLGCLGCAGTFIIMCCVAIGFVYLQLATIHDEGSPQLAEEWKTALEPLLDPDDAKKHNSLVEVSRFADGEWIIGLSQDSHGFYSPGGGTLVVKDSRGDVHVFFGHVCGPSFLRGFFGKKSLDEFYKYLKECGFQEYQRPPENVNAGP